MEVWFDNTIPIYLQLVQQIKLRIISGELQPGERLPSVRDLALQSRVNPNTMQKALSELEEQGLVYTERTNGKFVTEDRALIEQCKCEYADEMSKTYLRNMANIGYGKEQTVAYLTRFGGEKK